MHSVEVFLLVAGAVAVTAVCRRRGWPAPLVLVAAAIVVSVVPGIPRFEIEPEILLDFVLPPLLYSAALTTTSPTTTNSQQNAANATVMYAVRDAGSVQKPNQ